MATMGMTHQSLTLPALAVAVVSSILPDIDEPNALLLSKALPKKWIQSLKIILAVVIVLLFFYVAVFLPWDQSLGLLLLSALLLPYRKVRTILMAVSGLLLLYFAGSFWVPWSYIIGCLLICCSFLPHRGLTHSLYAIGIWGSLLFFTTSSFDSSIWIAGSMSYAYHLLADALTNRGIRPLPPLSWKLRLRLMNTGSKKGMWVEHGVIGLTLVWLWYVFY